MIFEKTKSENKIKKDPNKQSTGKKIVRGALIIMLVSVLSKFAAFIQEAVLAAYLGTTYQSDAFYMVTSIQQVVYPMLAVGVWKVFLPVYKEKISKHEYANADALANKYTTLLTIVSLVVVVLMTSCSDIVVRIVAPGFNPETKELCSQLVMLSSPMYIFIMAAAINSSMLQCHNKFFASQIREVASHIPVIISAIFFYRIWGIQTLAIALAIGGLFRVLIGLPFVDWGYRYKPDFKFKDPELTSMCKRMPSALLSEGVNQANILVDKIMASSLPVGAVSSLNYGSRLNSVFSGLFSSAVSTALYPQVVELVALDKKKELNSLMSKIMKIFALVMIPISFGCLFFSNDIVSLVYERGSFDAASTVITSTVFACYSIRLFFVACNSVMINVFYGYGDTKTPMYISIINMVVNIAGNFVFIYFWGVSGLALSTSVSAIIAFIAIIRFAKKYVQFEAKSILVSTTKITAAGIIACGIPAILFRLVDVNLMIELLISIIFGICVYFLLCRAFRIKEVDDLLAILKKKMKKSH